MGQTGRGAVSFEAAGSVGFDRAQILACKLSNPLSDVWSRLWRARFGDAGSVGQWHGGTIVERHVASVGNASRSVPRSNTTLREPLRAAPGSGRISRRATHLTTALLVGGVDLTPPLLLAPAPRRDAADTTGLAFTAARAITSCVIADAIVHRARSDLIRALPGSPGGIPDQGLMRWRKLWRASFRSSNETAGARDRVRSRSTALGSTTFEGQPTKAPGAPLTYRSTVVRASN